MDKKHAVLPQMPPKVLSAAELIPTMRNILREQAAARDAVVRTVSPSSATFANSIKPLIDVENRTQGEIAVIAMLRYASPDQAAREASDEAIGLLHEFESDFTAREDLYHIIKAVKDKAEDLDPESVKYLDQLLLDFTRCGQGRLSQDDIKLYLAGRNHIDSLRREYNRNIRNDDEGVWFSPEELDGVPEPDLARFQDGSGTEEPDKEGLKFVRFTRADVNAVLQYAKSPITRKKLYVANENKLPQNVDLFKEVIVRRDQNARLLGYPSHAAFRLEARVAKSPAWVDRLLSDLEKVLIPQGEREMKPLTERRKIDHPDDRSAYMPPWDYDYYRRLALEDLRVRETDISEFFPLNKTLLAMLEVFASCLQLRFDPVPTELTAGATWHEDVEMWSVWDERPTSRGTFVGYLYTDLLWRPNKHKGSQDVNLQCGYVKDDGTRVYPATILMCSFPRPTGTGCALLKHSEIISLFHELGHGIHDLVSRTSNVRFHGPRAPPDFFEVPSVMLENWCWMKNELRQMSCHYTRLGPEYMASWQAEHPGEACPPEKIPEEMLEGLVQSRYMDRALWFLRQLAFARFDMAVHSVPSHQACTDLDPSLIFNDFMGRLRLLPNPNPGDRGHPQANSLHLVSGMDAGYYSYLCAAVFAADIFQNTFAEDPRSQTAWERYRCGILEYGGSRNELEMLTEYLGHPPSPEYLLASFTLNDAP
ncbi:Metallopeptidase [Pleurostoma richardsiae]|uniref:Metallopeptidase n=1 Tax=Pleurostoma richardsiae TaxID=41990 RepID=A0AA38RQL8_9PEZI|nr:Metallopeptidase [Pleurostoma richardsiae]